MFDLRRFSEKLKRRGKSGKIISIGVCIYIMYYLSVVRKPRVIFKKDDPLMTSLLLRQLQLNRIRYWPIFIAPGRWAQILVLLVMTAKMRIQYYLGILKTIPYERTVVHTDKGDAVLHWVTPPAGSEQKPVVVIFPSLMGKHHEPLVFNAVNQLFASSYEVVVYNRRCHENESLYFSIMGDPYITEKVLAEIATERPGRGIFLMGFSAGTGAICRYMQDMAMGKCGNTHDVRFASMISPGYTSDFDPEANIWVLDRIIQGMNKMFLSAIHDAKASDTVMRLQECNELREWIRIAAQFSGYETVESFREHCCPGYPWSYFRAATDSEIAEMKYFPAVVFSARDDICFPWAVVKKYEPFFRRLHSIALIDADYGSHCTYFDNHGENWAVKISISIFDQIVQNKLTK